MLNPFACIRWLLWNLGLMGWEKVLLWDAQHCRWVWHSCLGNRCIGSWHNTRVDGMGTRVCAPCPLTWTCKQMARSDDVGTWIQFHVSYFFLYHLVENSVPLFLLLVMNTPQQCSRCLGAFLRCCYVIFIFGWHCLLAHSRLHRIAWWGHKMQICFNVNTKHIFLFKA